MKRKNNLYEQICSMENLQAAAVFAQQGKSKQYGVQLFNENADENLRELQKTLIDKTFKTSEYTIFPIYEPKERMIYRLPFFPDRIIHWAVMLVIRDILLNSFTADTYSSIKGRGVHAAGNAIKKALRSENEAQYCLQMDIKKFYPSIDHEILKQLLRRKFKDNNLLWLLDEIIDSAEGLPIGNLLSQSLSNFYLTPFDHWLKEKMKAKHYIRYADDMIILSGSKEYLSRLRFEADKYLRNKFKLEMKPNWQIYPTAIRGVRTLGYVYYPTHTLLGKKNKQRFARAVKQRKNAASINSYLGWAKHCDSKNLVKKLMNETI